MGLFHAYQSRPMQFAVDIFASLQRNGNIGLRGIQKLAKQDGLSYPDQVIKPLIDAGLLQQKDGIYSVGEGHRAFLLPLGQIERDYLQYILCLPESVLFLRESTIEKLKLIDGDPTFFFPIDQFAPVGESLPAYPGPEGFRTLLQAIRRAQMIRYEYRTKENNQWISSLCQPWKLEYSVYDRRWWVIIYLRAENRTVKSRLENLRNIQLAPGETVPEKTILAAMDRLLAPEPMVLEVSRERGAMERCFMVLENQLFIETKQISSDRFRLAFRYYRFDESELLRKLLFLGPMVTLIGPKSAKERMKMLIDQALAL